MCQVNVSTYKNLCEKKFDKLEADGQRREDKIDTLTAIVTNGLSDGVKRLQKLVWGILGALGVGAISLITMLIMRLVE